VKFYQKSRGPRFVAEVLDGLERTIERAIERFPSETNHFDRPIPPAKGANLNAE
jgi:hypothetical protein